MLAAFARRCGPCRMQEELPAEEPATPAPPADYDEAEARGIALYQASTPRARRPAHPHPHLHLYSLLIYTPTHTHNTECRPQLTPHPSLRGTS